MLDEIKEGKLYSCFDKIQILRTLWVYKLLRTSRVFKRNFATLILPSSNKVDIRFFLFGKEVVDIQFFFSIAYIKVSHFCYLYVNESSLLLILASKL